MNAPGPRLELRTGQSLVMTAQLQQSIKLLQLSSVELAEYLGEELDKNPLLSLEEGEDASRQEMDDGRGKNYGEENASSPEHLQSDSEESTPESDSAEATLDMPEEQSEAGEGMEAYATGSDSRHASFDDEESSLEQTLSEKLSLRDHLLAQLPIELGEPSERMIGAHLIDLVDDAGYIKEDLAPVAEQLGVSPGEVEAVLKQLQRLDPVGVCARDLGECLALQLAEKDRLDPAMQLFLKHLDLVAKGDLAQLKKICGVDHEDLKDMLAEIRQLNPKPGNQFPSEVLQPVIPDVMLKKKKDGGWHIELNPDALPRVLINRRYFSELNDKARNKQEKKYLNEQMATASWLVKALDQRAQTILKVATEIVAQQDAFFRHGVRYLKPLTLKDISVPVELHESTVSRVTSNKFMHTQRGTYRLKDFFTSSLSSASGEDVSSRSVQHMIREMIELETAKDILSDDAIAEKLQARGIDVARRTVAKYREEMKIPSSVQRRRDKSRAL